MCQRVSRTCVSFQTCLFLPSLSAGRTAEVTPEVDPIITAAGDPGGLGLAIGFLYVPGPEILT